MPTNDQSSIKNRLQDLLGYPREELDIELKGWLDLEDAAHKADLAKALIALANHGGGYVLIGFRESNGSWEPAAPRPKLLDAYDQDAVNGIVASSAEPAFHCDVHCLPHPTIGDVFPIIVVPGGRVPIRSKRAGPDDASHKPRHLTINTYYVRRPGPKSESPQTGQEWDQLISRCVRANREELLRTIVEVLGVNPTIHAQAHTPRRSDLQAWTQLAHTKRSALIANSDKKDLYKLGIWSCAYVLHGHLKKPSLGEFREILARVQGHETGWPVWWVPSNKELEPYPSEGMVECWLEKTTFRDAAHTDYWLGSPEGQMYLARGYQEDSMDRVAPGTALDLTIPIWRVGECLRHAERLAVELTEEGQTSVEVALKWTGLKGRQVQTLANPLRTLFPGYVSQQDSVESVVEVPADQITAALPDFVAQATRPLFSSFAFLEPPAALFKDEIDQMLQRVPRRL
jgi:hypothetical protein